jgi:BCCT, betaine/carnitine/choline family transporter
MTMKSVFHPLIGDRVFGWMGDLVDTISVVTTIVGVCTTLGLGAQQINTGLHRLNSDISRTFGVQVMTPKSAAGLKHGNTGPLVPQQEQNWLLGCHGLASIGYSLTRLMTKVKHVPAGGDSLGHHLDRNDISHGSHQTRHSTTV